MARARATSAGDSATVRKKGTDRSETPESGCPGVEEAEARIPQGCQRVDARCAVADGRAQLVTPARNDYNPIIAYLTVLPEHRGNGYIDEILAEGTRILGAQDGFPTHLASAAQGRGRIGAAVQDVNAPLVTPIMERRELVVRLPDSKHR